MKINKTQQKEIQKIRKIIRQNREEEDKLIAKLSTSMGIQDETLSEILWDYIYNGGDWNWMVELE